MKQPLHINSWGEVVLDSDPTVTRDLTPQERALHSRWAGMFTLAKPGMMVCAGIDEEGNEWIVMRLELEGEGRAFTNAVHEIARTYDGTVEPLDDFDMLYVVEFDVTDYSYDDFNRLVSNVYALIRSREAVDVLDPTSGV